MIYSIIGVGLFAIGFGFKILPISHLDSGIVKTLQEKLGRTRLLRCFEELWFLGRTVFTIIVLLLLTVINWKLGLTALSVFSAMAAVERLIKMVLDRPRPFSFEQGIKMLQPKQPTDPSFPSGDVLRAWFLALIFSAAIGNGVFFVVITTILAGLVSLGRMVFGVHYLTDVLSGIGLGFLGAGMTIWLWQILNII